MMSHNHNLISCSLVPPCESFWRQSTDAILLVHEWSTSHCSNDAMSPNIPRLEVPQPIASIVARTGEVWTGDPSNGATQTVCFPSGQGQALPQTVSTGWSRLGSQDCWASQVTGNCACPFMCLFTDRCPFDGGIKISYNNNAAKISNFPI